MTDLQINQLIAEHCGWNWYAVEKGGWYYRPSGHGYTNRISEAGRYSKKNANAEIVKGEPMSIVSIPVPDYCNDLNAMREAESRFNNPKDADSYIRNLLFETRNLIVSEDSLVLNSWAMYSLVNSTATQRAKAFLNTINKNKR